jgi:chitodextrinase
MLPMWGAAPRRRRLLTPALVAALVLAASLSVAPAQARTDYAKRPAASALELWGVEINPKTARLFTDKIASRARKAGLNTIVINQPDLTKRQWKRVTRLIKHHGFRPIVLPAAVKSAKGVEDSCARSKKSSPEKLCTVVARSWSVASQLAQTPNVDVVILRFGELGATKAVRHVAGQAKVLALVPVGAKINKKAWRGTIVRAARDTSFDLAVVPTGQSRARALTNYVGLLGDADVSPPSAPLDLALVSATQTSLRLTWSPSQDDHGVTAYGVYRSDSLIETVDETSVTLDGLSCGTNYLLRVDAVDGAGNRSAQSSLQASTASCPPPGGPPPGGSPPADAQPPSTPGSVAMTTSTPSTISIAWAPSTDNVRVSGYGLYLGPSPAGETPTTNATFTNLLCATSYTLSVDAYDAAGNRSTRSSLTAWTSACPEPDTTPPSDPSGLAVSVTATSVTLSWQGANDNIGLAGYTVYTEDAVTGTTGSTSYTVAGLACGKKHKLSVEAYDASGNRSKKISIDATTGACPVADTNAPAAPTGLVTGSATRTSLVLTWIPATDNVGVVGYGVYVGATRIATTTAVSNTVSGLTCGTSYSLSVDAYDAAGNRSTKATVTGSTSACPAPDTTAPTTPTGLNALGATQNTIVLSWLPSSDNIAVAGYTAYRGAASLGNTAATSFTVTGLSCGTSYTLSVDAYDTAGNRSPKATVNTSTSACPVADTTAPSTPTGLSPSAPTQSSITLSWSPSTDNVGVTGYGRYRNGTLLSSGSGTSFTFSGLACGTSYTFGVDAYDAAGNRSARSSVTSSTSPCPDTQAPSAPAGLSASGATNTAITLSWNAAGDNVGVTGYGRYRNGSLVSSGSGTSYTFMGLTCGTTYTLGVDAYDSAGNRSGRTQISASTTACPAADTQPPSVPQGLQVTGTTQATITMIWNASTDNVGVAGYRLYLNNALVASIQSLTYTYSSLQCGTTYSVSLEAYDAAGNASYRPEAVASATTAACPLDTQAPTAPPALAATGSTQTSISLAWGASLDNVGVVGYTVYNGAANVGSTASLSFNVSGLACNTGYTLAVDAYDSRGNRSPKTQITASTASCSAPPPPGSGSANLWVDTSGGSCLRLSTPAGYVDVQACGSLQAAANAAASGDTINIVDGTYPGQELSGTKSLTFRAAGPGRPSFGQLVSAASNITVRGILVENRSAQPEPFCSTWVLDYTLFVCAPNNTYDDVIVDGLHHGSGDSQRRGGIEVMGGATGFVFKNGEIRGVWDSKGFQGGADNMLLENNYWHDIRLTSAGGAAGIHNECVYITAGNNQIWRGNRFILCPVMAMFFANYAGGPPFSGVVVENNVFTHALNDDGSWHDGSSFVVPNGSSGQNQVNNWVVRYNTFEVPPSITSTPGGGDNNGSAQFYGNLGAAGDCGIPEWTYSYNLGSTCGGVGDVNVANAVNTRSSPNQAPFYVNAPGGDFHLKAGVAAIDKGDPGRFPSTDKDGKGRPVGPRPDAGAYEYG